MNADVTFVVIIIVTVFKLCAGSFGVRDNADENSLKLFSKKCQILSIYKPTSQHKDMILNNLADIQVKHVFPHSPVEKMFQLSGYVCSESLRDLKLISIMFMLDNNDSVTQINNNGGNS